MDRFTYLTDLRTRIIDEISGVRDANASLFWDDSRPNSLTKVGLMRLFEQARCGAESFGVFVVHRHGDCGSKRHGEDYLMEREVESALSYGDRRFEWRVPLDQSITVRPCPCGDDRDAEHAVLLDLLFDRQADQPFCEVVEQVLGDLYEALRSAGNKRPRSGIRERLLRALIVINDHIRPETLDAYIAARRA